MIKRIKIRNVHSRIDRVCDACGDTIRAYKKCFSVVRHYEDNICGENVEDTYVDWYCSQECRDAREAHHLLKGVLEGAV